MEIKIKKALVENFKGIKHKECIFGENVTDIRGGNGTGKTSLATAITWVLCDMDYQLNNKPTVQPLNDIEVKPRVKLWLDVDGREITVEKAQKTVIKEDANSGKITQTTNNTYSVNDVPKTNRDFVQYFSELGIDLDKFAILSHPDAFTKDDSKKGREQMREVLFKMASEKTDLEIARTMFEIPELTIALEKGYKLDEVKAMNLASIKKIDTENGKDNRLIDSRIQGLLEGKADVNTAGIVERELETKKEIRQTEERINLLSAKSGNTEIAKIQLEIELAKSMAKESYFAEKEAFIEKRNELSGKYREIEDVIAKTNKIISDGEHDLEIYNTTLEDLRKDYEKEFAKQFEGNTECPVCHRPLPEEMVNEAKAQFEQYKATNIANIKEAADKVNKNIDSRTQEMNDARETINRITPSLEMLKVQLNELEKEPVIEPVYDNLPDVVALQDQINRIKQKADDSSDKEQESLNEALRSLRNELSEIEGTYKVLENNKAIDSKVTELREKKIADEQHRAEAEKMLYQIEQFERRKNEMLTEEINKHFGLVEWKLFDFQKNGSYQECCIPTYQGKNINTQTNAALSIMLKIDIAVSLQKFYDLYVPVVVDEAERLDRSSRNHIKCDSQLIYLTVSDDQEIVGC